jgi:hypothetical protein
MSGMYTPGEFEVEFDAGRLAVVRLLGEHDISTTQALAERLGTRRVRQPTDVRPQRRRVPRLRGRDVIEEADADARARGVPLAVVVPSHAKLARRLLEITGLVEKIPVFETRADAEREIIG